MSVTWIEIIAVVLGPIVAVVITLWYQQRQRDYERKLSVFEALILWRRQVVRVEWVNAFNLVPVHFRKHPEVIRRHRALADHFSNPAWEGASGEALTRLIDRLGTLNAELIGQIGLVINVKIPDLEILKGAYSPRYWDDQELENSRARTAALAVLEGRSAIKVAVNTTSSELR